MFDPQFMSEDPTARDVRRFKSRLWAVIRDRGFGAAGPSIFRIQVGEKHSGKESLVVTLSTAVQGLKLEKLFPYYAERRVFFIYTDAIDVHDTFSEILLQASLSGRDVHLIVRPDEEQDATAIGVFFVDPSDDDGDGYQPHTFSAN